MLDFFELFDAKWENGVKPTSKCGKYQMHIEMSINAAAFVLLRQLSCVRTTKTTATATKSRKFKESKFNWCQRNENAKQKIQYTFSRYIIMLATEDAREAFFQCAFCQFAFTAMHRKHCMMKNVNELYFWRYSPDRRHMKRISKTWLPHCTLDCVVNENTKLFMAT